jgi:hypothetical protein
MDEVRTRRARTSTSLDEVAEAAAPASNTERSVLGALAAEQLWAAVLRHVQDDAEREVAHLSFARDLKPAEIFDRHPQLFDSVADVYRIKRNLIERLRRSPEIRDFLAP